MWQITDKLTPFGKHLLHSDNIHLPLYELSSALTLWSERTSWYNHVLYFRGLWGLPGHGQWDVLQPLLPRHVPALQDLHLADQGPGAVQDLTQLHPFRYRGHKCKNYSSKKNPSFSYEAFQKFFIMKSMPVDKTGFFSPTRCVMTMVDCVSSRIMDGNNHTTLFSLSKNVSTIM